MHRVTKGLQKQDREDLRICSVQLPTTMKQKRVAYIPKKLRSWTKNEYKKILIKATLEIFFINN